MPKKKYIFNPITGRLNIVESAENETKQEQKQDAGNDKKITALEGRVTTLESGQIVYADRYGVTSSDKISYKLPINEYKRLNGAKKFFLSLKMPIVEQSSYSSSSMVAGDEPVYIIVETANANVLVPLYVKQGDICHRRDIADKENFIFVQINDDMSGGEAYIVNGERAESTPSSIYPANATIIEQQTETIVLNDNSTENIVIMQGNGAYEITPAKNLSEDKHISIWLDYESERKSYLIADGTSSALLRAGGYVDCFYSKSANSWSFSSSDIKNEYHAVKRFEEVRGALYDKQRSDRAYFGNAFYPNGNSYTIVRWGDEPSQVSMLFAGWGYATKDEVHSPNNIATRFFNIDRSGARAPFFEANYATGSENTKYNNLILYAGASYNQSAPLGSLNPTMCNAKQVFYADINETRLRTINAGNARPLIDGGMDNIYVQGREIEGQQITGSWVRREYTAVYGTYNQLANPEAQGANVNFLCRVGEMFAMYYQQKNYPLIHTNRKAVQMWGAEFSFGTAYKSPALVFGGFDDETYIFSGYRASDGQWVQQRYNNRICSPDYNSGEFWETPYLRESVKKATSGWYSVQYEDDPTLHHGMVRIICGRRAGNTEYNAESSETVSEKGAAVFEANWKATHVRTMNNGKVRPLIDGGTDVVSVRQGSYPNYDYSTKVEREYTAIYGTYSNTANSQAKNANVNFFAKIGDDYCTYYQTGNAPLIDATYAGVKFYKHQKQDNSYASDRKPEIYLGGKKISGIRQDYYYDSVHGYYIVTSNFNYDVLSNYGGGSVSRSLNYGEYINGFGDQSINHNVFGSGMTDTLLQGGNVYIRSTYDGGSSGYGSINIGRDNAWYKEDIKIGLTTDRSTSFPQTRRIFIGDDYAYLELYIKGKNFQTEVLDKIAALESQNSALSSSLSSAQSALTAAQSNIATLQSDLAAAQSDLSTAQTELATTKTDLTAAQSDITTLQSDLATAQSDLSTAQTELATTKTDLTAAQSDITTLQSDLAAALQRIAALEGNNV